MISDNCHLCNCELFSSPIIELKGMPRAAQYFPTKDDFKNEFERYMEILQGTSKDASDYIIKDYNPDYVFSGKVKQDVQLFNYIVGHKENYKAVYEDEWCAVLEVGAKI